MFLSKWNMSYKLKSFVVFFKVLIKIGCKVTVILLLRSRSCRRTVLAAISSLKRNGDKNLLNEDQFRVLKKCHGKFGCLVDKMLFIIEVRPSLNTQRDCISAKLFVWLVAYFYVTYCFSCIYRLFILSFLPLDSDAWERQNAVYFLTVLKKILKCFKEKFFRNFL